MNETGASTIALLMIPTAVSIGVLLTGTGVVAVGGAVAIITGVVIAVTKHFTQVKNDRALFDGPIHIRLPARCRISDKEVEGHFEPATEKQMAFIKKLGRVPDPYISKTDASSMIASLLNSVPPTNAQIRMIKSLSCAAEIPSSKLNASELIQQLKMTVPAIKRQHAKAIKLGIEIPEGWTYRQAEELISNKEMDDDPEDGKPPTKQQINKITRLGGIPTAVTNRWRAEEYISVLEDKRENEKDEKEQWVEYILEWYFGPNDDFKTFDMKKPSKAFLRKVYDYAKAQGFEAEWESDPSTFERVILSIAASRQ